MSPTDGTSRPLALGTSGPIQRPNKVPLSPEDHTTLGAMESLLELVRPSLAQTARIKTLCKGVTQGQKTAVDLIDPRMSVNLTAVSCNFGHFCT
jgi:hypothetical protein